MCWFLSRHKLPGWSRNVTASRRSWSSPDLPLPAGLTTPPVEPIPLIEEDDSTESRVETGGGEGGGGGEKKEGGGEEERTTDENEEEREVGEKTEEDKSDGKEEREADVEATAVKTSEKVC